jgi:hypothetical protein
MTSPCSRFGYHGVATHVTIHHNDVLPAPQGEEALLGRCYVVVAATVGITLIALAILDWLAYSGFVTSLLFL